MGVSVFSRDSLFFLSALCGFAAAAAPAFHQTIPGFVPSSSDNMNGAYPMSPTPGGTPGKFPRRFADYPGGAEHYDVYSPPMTTLYSQVWWSPLAPTPLPNELVEKYRGKGMAIIGWEIDQVRRVKDPKTGALIDHSVPISATYNHHYVSQLVGAGSKFRKYENVRPDSLLGAKLRRASSHGMVNWDQPQYVVEETTPSSLGVPTAQYFSSANGGEYRKTFHGFPPGFALVVDSPESFQITPMQIDTWNRAKMNISGPIPPKFYPGPMPRASQAPAENPEYSGLLECPVTTRIVKAIDGTYVAQNKGTCSDPILTFQECFHAAATLLEQQPQETTFVNTTVDDSAQPPGCTAAVAAPSIRQSSSSSSAPVVHVTFNEHTTSSVTCAADNHAVMGSSITLPKQTVQMTLHLNATSNIATITLVCDSDVWCGVGFGAHAMADAPWTIVVDGTGAVSERQLANHAAGKVLPASVSVVSNAVDTKRKRRTVVMTRNLKGADARYYTFVAASAQDATIPLIVAVGSGPQFGYHKEKTPTSITLLPIDSDSSGAAGACICPKAPPPFGEATGSLVYHQTAQDADTGEGAVGFGAHKCAEWPATNIMNQTNPTCDVRHYRGGQWACHHMWSLLDADQEIPWTDQPLVFHHKYRFWVQPFNASYHTQLDLGETAGSAMLIGSPWEYDVPKCRAGVPGCSLVEGTWIHTIKGNKIGKHNFTALNFHCHAPTCLSMAVYACAVGTPLEECTEENGKLLCLQRPVYGGSGDPALNGTRFDEPGYIAIPDCFWGDAEFGLEPPPDVDGVPLHIVKTANATWGHYGEMAGGQPWVF